MRVGVAEPRMQGISRVLAIKLATRRVEYLGEFSWK